MPKPSNKQIERHYFDAFRKVYTLPEGVLEHRDKPDAIISGPRKIGIEITNFFLENGELTQSEQKQKPLRKTVVDKAYAIHRAQGGGPYGVTFQFDKSHPIESRKTNSLAKHLAEFVGTHVGRISGPIDRRLFRNELPQIADIYLSAPNFPDTQWRIAQVYNVGLTNKDAIEAIVQSKAVKASEYEMCDAYWLLIVVDGMDSAQDQEIRLDNLNICSHGFEKVILFHTFGYVTEAIIT
jgi:hypothetical protein